MTTYTPRRAMREHWLARLLTPVVPARRVATTPITDAFAVMLGALTGVTDQDVWR